MHYLEVHREIHFHFHNCAAESCPSAVLRDCRSAAREVAAAAVEEAG